MNIDTNKILNYILNYQIQQGQYYMLTNSKNKSTLLYDMILEDIKETFGIDFKDNFEIALNVKEIADSLCENI